MRVCESEERRTLLFFARNLLCAAKHLWPLLALRSHVDFRVGMNWAGFAVSPDGRYAAAGGARGDLFVWEVEAEKVAVKLKGHRAAVSGVSWGAGENQVASADKDGSLIFWQ